MITRSNLAEQLREYQIQCKYEWAPFSISSANAPSRADVIISVMWELFIFAFLVLSGVSLYLSQKSDMEGSRHVNQRGDEVRSEELNTGGRQMGWVGRRLCNLQQQRCGTQLLSRGTLPCLAVNATQSLNTMAYGFLRAILSMACALELHAGHQIPPFNYMPAPSKHALAA